MRKEERLFKIQFLAKRIRCSLCTAAPLAKYVLAELAQLVDECPCCFEKKKLKAYQLADGLINIYCTDCCFQWTYHMQEMRWSGEWVPHYQEPGSVKVTAHIEGDC